MDIEQTLQQVEKISQQAIEYLSARANLERIGKITAISVATYVVANKLYDAYFGPLSRVPGPFIGKFMNVPRMWYDRPRGTSYKKFRDLHDFYGEYVRLGPKLLSVSDKDVVKQVIVTDDLPKGPIYKIFQANRAESLFSTVDNVWHKNRRRVVSPAFSIKYLKSLEPFVSKVTETFIYKIDKEIEQNHDSNNYGQVDIWSLVQRLALDVIGETAFGQTFHMVENNNHFIPAAIGVDLKESAISAMYPWLARFILKHGGKGDPRIKEFMAEIIEARLKDKSNDRKDILQSLINTRDLKEQDDHLTAEAIMSETILFLIAGSETTSNTIGFAIIELLRSPSKLAKLQAEIDQIELEEGQIVFKHEQLKHLPYLNAVINETMRIDAVAAGGLVRITDRPMFLGQLKVDKDTVVIVNLYHTQTNGKYWPNPTKFIPERWIPEEQVEMDSDLEAFFPFSAGTRNCIGKNFALQEMRICLSTLVRHYDILPIASEMKDAENIRTFITMSVAKNKFDLKIKRRTPIN